MFQASGCSISMAVGSSAHLGIMCTRVGINSDVIEKRCISEKFTFHSVQDISYKPLFMRATVTSCKRVRVMYTPLYPTFI